MSESLPGLRAKVLLYAASGVVLVAAAALGWNFRIGRPQFRPNPIDPTIIEVLVRHGNFDAGMQADNRRGGQLALPPRQVWLDDYWIEQTQVTNVQYAHCVAAGACSVPLDAELNPHFYDEAYANHPVVFVTWQNAADFCAWVGGRLPTELEWEKAARGDQGRLYAWGEANPELNAYVNINNIHDGTVPVGYYPESASQYGVLDMGGNVREWVFDWYSEDGSDALSGPETGEAKVLRGASWFDPGFFSMTFDRLQHVPDSPGQNRGFRCAFSDQ
ncbi:MAG: SUMF1/EgtB/PvdO family nonheme iron enzyme [Anaerolineales bacterium]|nr:SUMF1/EgtB/PvdO family nonheme iron enzyme [Anaerolineales bacterium]QYK51445.1 MAG: SUMF1/EgtB/PvdO family nonheme iron enzyme [Anaerolineales bacterium]